jgi:hypothetical protein
MVHMPDLNAAGSQGASQRLFFLHLAHSKWILWIFEAGSGFLRVSKFFGRTDYHMATFSQGSFDISAL